MKIRDFTDTDADAINRIAVAAFRQFSDQYDDWPAFVSGLQTFSRLSEAGELAVAEHNAQIVGAVAYVPPTARKADCFDPAWPVIRMLVVDPESRGLGIGRELTETCISKARRDGSNVIALHTSPIMKVALGMYQRMGFEKQYEAPPIYGVPYNVYLKTLNS